MAVGQAEHDALARDARDAWRLALIDAILAEVLDLVAKLTEPLESPGRRWHPGDLVDDLVEHRDSIRMELARIKGPLMIEDQDT